MHDNGALHCKDYHLDILSNTAQKKFSSLPRCEIDKNEKLQTVRVRTSLLLNTPFVNELRKGMGGHDNYNDTSVDPGSLAAWQEKWRGYYPASSATPPPTNAEDFIAHFPLSQVCDMRLYNPEPSQ